MKLTKTIFNDCLSHLNFNIVKELSDNTVFNNLGYIDLGCMVIKNCTFNNKGEVYLRHLEIMRTGVIFNNTGDVYLRKNVLLNELNYTELLNLSNKLTNHSFYLNKKDILYLIRERKLNKIL